MIVPQEFVLSSSELYNGRILGFQGQEVLFLIKHHLLLQDLEFVANYFYCHWKSFRDIRQAALFNMSATFASTSIFVTSAV